MRSFAGSRFVIHPPTATTTSPCVAPCILWRGRRSSIWCAGRRWVRPRRRSRCWRAPRRWPTTSWTISTPPHPRPPQSPPPAPAPAPPPPSPTTASAASRCVPLLPALLNGHSPTTAKPALEKPQVGSIPGGIPGHSRQVELSSPHHCIRALWHLYPHPVTPLEQIPHPPYRPNPRRRRRLRVWRSRLS